METIIEKREDILQIAAKHGAYHVQVFGSVAREEASSDSDVDFLVDVGSNHSRWFPGGFLADARRFVGL